MQSLDPRSRNAILASSAACFLGAIALSPLSALSARSTDPAVVNDVVLRPAHLATPAPLPPLRAVLPHRDPFVGSRDESDVALDAVSPSAVLAAAGRPQSDPIPSVPPLPYTDGGANVNPNGTLPPNSGAHDTASILAANGNTGASGQTGPVVRAVIVGDHPYAVVEDGQTTRVIGIDARLAGKRVRAIDLSGVLLEDGERLPVTKADAPAEAAPNGSSLKRENIIVLPPGFKYEGPGASPAPDGSAKPDTSANTGTRGPSEYQPYTTIPPAGSSTVPLQPLPTQFGYGQPSYGQPGYQAPAPAPSSSPGPTFGQTF